MPKRNGKSGICCPSCESYETRVLRTEPQDDRVKRRLECTNCGDRCTTFERRHNAPPPAPGIYRAENLESIAQLLSPLGISVDLTAETPEQLLEMLMLQILESRMSARRETQGE